MHLRLTSIAPHIHGAPEFPNPPSGWDYFHLSQRSKESDADASDSDESESDD